MLLKNRSKIYYHKNMFLKDGKTYVCMLKSKTEHKLGRWTKTQTNKFTEYFHITVRNFPEFS